MNVGKRIIEIREKRNITTNKLANKAGISQSYLREIELGGKNPTIEILSYICDALDISLKEFFSTDSINVQPSLVTAIEKLSQDEQLKLAEFLNEIKK